MGQVPLARCSPLSTLLLPSSLPSCTPLSTLLLPSLYLLIPSLYLLTPLSLPLLPSRPLSPYPYHSPLSTPFAPPISPLSPLSLSPYLSPRPPSSPLSLSPSPPSRYALLSAAARHGAPQGSCRAPTPGTRERPPLASWRGLGEELTTGSSSKGERDARKPRGSQTAVRRQPRGS